MLQCDSSQTCTRAVRPEPSPADLQRVLAGVSEVSRFSCLKFLDVPWGLDHAGLNRNSRCRSCPCCLPRILTASASGLYVFAAQYPPRLSSIYASLGPSRYQRKTRGQVVRYSFLVRIPPPLLQAGLSRRTNIAISLSTIRKNIFLWVEECNGLFSTSDP
jgi:hypothetical protein